MLFYYIRHGDPIYRPNSLTPLGQRQAEAVSKRLALHGLDKIYSSPSERALQTAMPTCEVLKQEPEILDFTNESHAYREFTLTQEDGSKRWLFNSFREMPPEQLKEFRDLGDRWYMHPSLADYNFEAGVKRVYAETDAFFAELGYEHIPYTGVYKVTKSNDQKVALFAHQGFGLIFLSCLLDIPYPSFATHFNINHSGITVINFAEKNGYCTPDILTLSSEAHLYHEGLPTKFENKFYI